MGAGASVSNLQKSDLISYVKTGKEGKYVDLGDILEQSEATNNLLTCNTVDEFTGVMKEIGVEDEAMSKSLFTDLSTVKATLTNNDPNLTVEVPAATSSANADELLSPARKPQLKEKSAPTGQTAKEKMEKLRRQNSEAIENLKASHASKMELNNKRLKERIEAKKRKKMQIMTDRGVPAEEVKKVEEQYDKHAEIMAQASEIQSEMHAEEWQPQEAADIVDVYEPLVSWLTDWVVSYGADINDEDNNGLNALMYACQGGRPSLADLFISKGADVNAASSDGSCALHIAAQWGHEDVVDLLLARGAKPDAVNADGWTPLLFASIGGHAKCTEHLLQFGAKTDIPDHDGYTALVYATEGEHDEVVKLLQGAGAKLIPTEN